MSFAMPTCVTAINQSLLEGEPQRRRNRQPGLGSCRENICDAETQECRQRQCNTNSDCLGLGCARCIVDITADRDLDGLRDGSERVAR